MEQSVYALVQDENARFGVFVNRKGENVLPTCMVDVGASFGPVQNYPQLMALQPGGA